nr:outer membrane beta-barrel protein [Helicobacter cetorum]
MARPCGMENLGTKNKPIYNNSKDKVNNTTFQFLVNLGMRLGGKHNHFEWGG